MGVTLLHQTLLSPSPGFCRPCRGEFEKFSESRCFLVLSEEHFSRSHSGGTGAPMALSGGWLFSSLFLFPFSLVNHGSFSFL